MKHLPYDVCRCLGINCKIKLTCKRFTDVGAPSLAMVSSMHDLLETKKCDAFIPVKNEN